MTPPSNLEALACEILDQCAVRGPGLEKERCALCLSAHNVALALDMDKDPLKSKLKDEGKRCDFAAYQRPNSLNNQACLILMEFKAKLHEVKHALEQLGASLEFLDGLSEIPNFGFDMHAPVLVCREEVGRRKTQRLMDVKVICMGVSICLRPLILISGQELTDKQIAERCQPRPQPKSTRKRRKG